MGREWLTTTDLAELLNGVRSAEAGFAGRSHTARSRV
jgi:hypothetical protein